MPKVTPRGLAFLAVLAPLAVLFFLGALFFSGGYGVFPDGASAGVSSAGTTRIGYNNTIKEPMASVDASPWFGILPMPSQHHWRQVFWYTVDRTGANGASIPIGTLGTTGTGGNTNNVDGAYETFTTGAVSGNAAGQENLNDLLQTRWKAFCCSSVRTDSTITSTRQWIGLFSADPEAGDQTPTTTLRFGGWRYSTNASDTTWKLCAGDGANGSCSDSTVTYSGSTHYNVCFYLDTSKLVGMVAAKGGVYTMFSHSTNVDSTGTTGLRYHDKITTLTNAARVFSRNFAA